MKAIENEHTIGLDIDIVIGKELKNTKLGYDLRCVAQQAYKIIPDGPVKTLIMNRIFDAAGFMRAAYKSEERKALYWIDHSCKR